MQLIGFLAMLFIGFTLLNRILEGAFIAAADIDIINNLTITRDQEIFGFFTIPVPNTDFFFEGLPKLLTWDYSFFGGNAEILLYLFYSITAAVTFMLFATIIGVAGQFLSRR